MVVVRTYNLQLLSARLSLDKKVAKRFLCTRVPLSSTELPSSQLIGQISKENLTMPQSVLRNSELQAPGCTIVISTKVQMKITILGTMLVSTALLRWIYPRT